jgi:hypothetical protein
MCLQFAFCLLSLVTSAFQNIGVQPRADAAAVPAHVSGRVVSETTGTPVRGAVVVLKDAARDIGVLGISDDDGLFSIQEVPAGSYTLTATKPRYVPTYYGSKRRGFGPGMPITLAAGDDLRELIVELSPGAVIAGRISDHLGRSQGGATVSVLDARRIGAAGSMRAVATATSDDLGQYRVYGLPAGDFVVVVQPGFNFNAATLPDANEADRALAQGQTGRVGVAEPQPARTLRPKVAYAPTVYPASVGVDQAMAMTLTAGEERLGVDVQLQFVRVANVEGRVVDPLGRAAAAVQIAMVWPGHKLGLVEKSYMGTIAADAAFTVRDGRFSRRGLVPGRYVIHARGTSRPDDTSSPAKVFDLWATQQIDIDGEDINDLVIGLQPGFEIAGLIVLDESAAASQPVLELSLTSQSDGPFRQTVSARSMEGRFAFPRVPPGNYDLEAKLASGQRVAVRRIEAGASVAVDSILSVSQAVTMRDIVVNLSRRVSSLSGLLVDRLEQPTADYYVVVVSADTKHWSFPTKRLRFARADRNGRYEIADLPDGAYFVSAVTEMSPDDLSDQRFLELVAKAGRRIEMAPGEEKVFNLQILGETDERGTRSSAEWLSLARFQLSVFR